VEKNCFEKAWVMSVSFTDWKWTVQNCPTKACL
jgi:hypothetical protein